MITPALAATVAFDVDLSELSERPERSPRKPSASHNRWPMVLCAVIAVVAAGAAFVASPTGDRMGAHRATQGATSHVTAAARATLTLIAR